MNSITAQSGGRNLSDSVHLARLPWRRNSQWSLSQERNVHVERISVESLVDFIRWGLSLPGERLCDIQVIFSQTQPLGLCHDNQLWLDATPGVVGVVTLTVRFPSWNTTLPTQPSKPNRDTRRAATNWWLRWLQISFIGQGQQTDQTCDLDRENFACSRDFAVKSTLSTQNCDICFRNWSK